MSFLFKKSNNMDLKQSLSEACLSGDFNLVKKITPKLVNLNQRISLKNTALHLSSLYGHLDIVQFLLENGAKVDIIGEYNNTPLHLASTEGNLDIVEFLVNNGADINYTNKFGCTPLHNASGNGNLEVVKFLVNNGADIDAIDENSYTPFKYATSIMYIYDEMYDVIKFLLKRGAIIGDITNITDKNVLEWIEKYHYNGGKSVKSAK